MKFEELAEQMHIWYLEATLKLHPESFNPNAQKKYEDLTDEQKFIDIFIAKKVEEKFRNKWLEVFKDACRKNEEEVIKNWLDKNCIDKQRVREVIDILKDIIGICKLKCWDSEVGDKKAQEMIDKIHQGKFGDNQGIWVQVGNKLKELGL